MAQIQWDAPGEHFYEVGVDRGVFYHSSVSNGGTPWNGLISVNEKSSGGDLTQHYLDGFIYFNEVSPTDFQATLEAFTYPQEFENVNGSSYSGAMSYEDQPIRSEFGLSYRTMIGNEIVGATHGYKIHILYNLIALPRTGTIITSKNPDDPANFSWDLIGRPMIVAGVRPTSHVVWDSTRTDDYKTREIERILYGENGTKPRLPSIDELEGINNWEKGIRIIPKNLTGLHETTYLGEADLIGSPAKGLFTKSTISKLSNSESTGLYTLGV